MLSSINIQNYALLKDVNIMFGPGLNIITGETGAGKSIMIGAINLAIGERGYIESIRTGEESAKVEAVFNLKDDKRLLNSVNSMLENAGIDAADENLIIKRELSRQGKSKVFINNSASSQGFLQELGKLLIDIHGQHEHQSLLSPEIHIDLLDEFARASEIRGEIAELYLELSSVNSEIKRLLQLEKDKKDKLEMLEYRLNEIEQAGFKNDSEYDDLIQLRSRLLNVTNLKEAVSEAIIALSPSSLDIEGSGAIDLIEKASASVKTIIKIDKKYSEGIDELLSEANIRLSEIRERLVSYLSKIEADPQALAVTEERITLFENLMKKFKKNDFKELFKYGEILKNELKEIRLNSDLISVQENKRKEIIKKLGSVCVKLSDIRRKAAEKLGKMIEDELKGLSINKAVFKVDCRIRETDENDMMSVKAYGKNCLISHIGIDEVEFLVSLNPGEDLKPLVKIASGGEISRIMLAIKNILSKEDIIPTLVFDEIDTGISGKVASSVGKKIREIASKKQVICITHLPQIASQPGTHFNVKKITSSGKTETIIEKIDAKEREIEIARLISGENITEDSITAARGLIEEALK